MFVSCTAVGAEDDRDRLCFTIGIYAKIVHLGFIGTFRQIILLVPGYTSYIKPFGVGNSRSPIGIDHVIRQPVIGFVEYCSMDDVFSDIGFVVYLDHLHDSPSGKHNDVIEVGALCNKLIFFETGSDKTFRPVHVETNIGNGHLTGLYHIKWLDLGFALPSFTVFILKALIIGNRKLGEVLEMVLCLADLLLNATNLHVQLFNIQLVNAADGFLCELNHIFTGDVSSENLLERIKTLLDGKEHLSPIVVFLFQLFIDLLLKKDAFQRSEMPFLLQLGKLDLQFFSEQFTGIVCGNAQQV